jgi:hypothetical protein
VNALEAMIDAVYGRGHEVDTCPDCLGIVDIHPAITEVTQ